MDSGQAVAAFDAYLKVRRREVRELAVKLGLKEVQWMALRYLASCNGMSDQQARIWSPNGTLIALTNQIAFFR